MQAFHDYWTPFLVWAFSGNFKAFEASALHIMLDRGHISPSLVTVMRVLGGGK